jgi:hypothetical protein
MAQHLPSVQWDQLCGGLLCILREFWVLVDELSDSITSLADILKIASDFPFQRPDIDRVPDNENVAPGGFNSQTGDSLIWTLFDTECGCASVDRWGRRDLRVVL